MRYTKVCSQLFIKYQPAGIAIKNDMPIRIINSLENSMTTLLTEAPSTLRIPTSLVRCTAMNETRPYKPRQEIKMAIPANIL